MECSHKCGGVCCRDFIISSPPEDIGRIYAAAKARLASGVDVQANDAGNVFIAEMLIRIDEPDEASPRYTCKHFDEPAGLCRVYDQRPDMCRNYPYGQPCFHCGFSNAPDPLVAIERKRLEITDDAKAAENV